MWRTWDHENLPLVLLENSAKLAGTGEGLIEWVTSSDSSNETAINRTAADVAGRDDCACCAESSRARQEREELTGICRTDRITLVRASAAERCVSFAFPHNVCSLFALFFAHCFAHFFAHCCGGRSIGASLAAAVTLVLFQ